MNVNHELELECNHNDAAVADIHFTTQLVEYRHLNSQSMTADIALLDQSIHVQRYRRQICC